MTELRAALEELKGMTPKDIAAMLERRKITGRPATTYGCPLAKLMHGVHSGQFVVGQKFIMRTTGAKGQHVEKLPTPPNIAAFVRMFDHSQFPNLIAPPPRCVAKLVKAAKDRARKGRSGNHRATRKPATNHHARVVGRL